MKIIGENEVIVQLEKASGRNGRDGKDGYSPTISVEAITGGHRVTITDATGTQYFDVMDGSGGSGSGGADGYSPTVSVTTISGGHRVSITDVGGTKTFDVMDGADGAQGPAGADGKSAYAYAQDGGYTGSEAQFAAKLAQEMPTLLPNPHALTLTGAVSATYDGSAAVSVEIPAGGSGSYTLPIASPSTLGGVMPVAKTDEMTQAVGVDEAGGLWALPGGEKDWTKICGGNITEEVASIVIDANADGTPISNLDINEMVIMGRIYLTGDSNVRFEYNGLWTSGNYFIQSKLGAWSHAFIIHIVRYLDRWCVKYSGGTTVQVITPTPNFVSFEIHIETDGVLFASGPNRTELNVYYR